jgi:uncharacterized protein YndB with AHSA1/START domain
MIRFESEQTIDRSAGDVWAYAADVQRHPTWMAIEDAAILKGASGEVGTTFRETIKMGGRRYGAELVVSEAVPGKVVAWQVTGGMPIAGEARLELEEMAPGRTKARWSGAFRLMGLWRLAEPLMAGEIRSSEAAELVRLKGILEAPASTPAGG